MANWIGTHLPFRHDQQDQHSTCAPSVQYPGRCLGLSGLERLTMTAQDRGSARLAKLLADPQRAARVAAIREQMNQPNADSPGLDDDDNDRQTAGD